MLQRRIELAEVINPAKQSGNQVLFGATVIVLTGEEELEIQKIEYRSID